MSGGVWWCCCRILWFTFIDCVMLRSVLVIKIEGLALVCQFRVIIHCLLSPWEDISILVREWP